MTRQRSRGVLKFGFWLTVLVGMIGIAGLFGPESANGQTKAKVAKGKLPPPGKAFGKNEKAQASNQNTAPPAPRSSLLTEQAWQKAALTPLQPGELDELIVKELRTDKIEPAPLTTDEQFIRRVTLDLTGQLPVPAEVKEFVADPKSDKRARLINRLLETEEYARHWARYWRDVIGSRVSDRRGLALARSFELWMTDQMRENQGWDKVARALITAEGSCSLGEDDAKNGAIFFLGAHMGNDSANEHAAETSRVFLGIQIQCAQCHDHPSDQWKRVQFHELAGYFARVRPRLRREDGRPAAMDLVAVRFGEHEMPSQEDPKKTLVTHPRFLDGKAAGMNLSDVERRRSLASAIVDKRNYWFAGAYVNRIWGELMGQSFYLPVDDMGPQKEAVFPSVLTRLTGAFRGTNYDVKEMFRAVMNSQAYQRQIRLGETADQHLHFAAAYPSRLRADALWDSLTSVLGTLGIGRGTPPPRPLGPGILRAPGLEGFFKDEFSFDPSLKADEVEGSIPQALLMMNNPVINQKLQARGTNVLGRILSSYPQDDEAIRMVYLKTLARKPTDGELKRCKDYITRVGIRGEAFEDILWALLNSAEFQTKR